MSVSEVIHEVKPNPWKLGFIYVNADDPRLIVRQRTGLGWTLNMARPAAWAILASLVGMWLLRRMLAGRR